MSITTHSITRAIIDEDETFTVEVEYSRDGHTFKRVIVVFHGFDYPVIKNFDGSAISYDDFMFLVMGFDELRIGARTLSAWWGQNK